MKYDIGAYDLPEVENSWAEKVNHTLHYRHEDVVKSTLFLGNSEFSKKLSSNTGPQRSFSNLGAFSGL